ncbi:hypothetical protein [Brevibacterium jeotgali]|uniref:hypothetical protein n=1 Tax=Brevibacterium jeotgali TaxID=1262550 RepID=UPI0015E09586|nr:hypothetical protein [Brevibacterium jeotgali]
MIVERTALWLKAAVLLDLTPAEAAESHYLARAGEVPGRGVREGRPQEWRSNR